MSRAAAVVAVALVSLVAGNFAESAPAAPSAATCITQVVGEKDRSAFLVLRKASAALCRDLRSKLTYGKVVPLRSYTPHGGETFVEEQIASLWYKGRRLDMYAYWKSEAEKTLGLVLRQRGVTSWWCNGAGYTDPDIGIAKCEAARKAWRP